MLDRDLAEFYDVETKRLNEAVRRNFERFPDDFIFEFTEVKFKNLSTQFASSSWGSPKYLPMAFTDQGVAMLSSVLNSKPAIKVNIRNIRLFTKMSEEFQRIKIFYCSLNNWKQKRIRTMQIFN